ncbi:MAG: ABC transporter permease [Chloroflexota bacterium]|nr:ABC transporter permease [Chloroflexota bacterium]
MSVRQNVAGRGVAGGDERLANVSPLRRLLVRPEMGAVAGAIGVWVVFAIRAGDRGFVSMRGTANYLEVAAQLGILAVAVALLMIGGEFDLSVGSIIGACGMITALLAAEEGWNLGFSIAASFLFALLIGVFNGFLVLRTGLPSFIVTLGTLLIIRGITIGVTRNVTGRTVIGGLNDVPGYEGARSVFANNLRVGAADFSVSILWWLGVAAVATWVLLRTSFGNWIFGVGGNLQAARNVGVPVSLVKIALFMSTAAAAWLVSTIQVLDAKSADVVRGGGAEFTAIIAAVIGGTLLTGGYGSAIGAVFGALIYGMVRQGIVFSGVDPGWEDAVLGAMLVVAVIVNRYIRTRAMEARS